MFPGSSTWSVVEAEGNCPSARDKLAATAVDKLIYYFGGFGPQGGDEEDWEDVSINTRTK